MNIATLKARLKRVQEDAPRGEKAPLPDLSGSIDDATFEEVRKTIQQNNERGYGFGGDKKGCGFDGQDDAPGYGFGAPER